MVNLFRKHNRCNLLKNSIIGKVYLVLGSAVACNFLHTKLIILYFFLACRRMVVRLMQRESLIFASEKYF